MVNIPDLSPPCLMNWQTDKRYKGKCQRDKKADISVHCHNDLGTAVANSLAAVMNGAQVECNKRWESGPGMLDGRDTMGIRPGRIFGEMVHNIDTRQIYRSSKLVSKLTGEPAA